MKSLVIAWGKAGMLLFGGAVLWLAGVYLGGIFMFLFLFYTGLLGFSLVQVLVSLSVIKIYQSFSTEHPIKGEGIGFSLVLANESLLPGCRLKMKYRHVQPGVTVRDDGRELYLGIGKEYKSRFEVHCPYRGIYTIGLEYLEFSDLTGFLHVRKSVEYRTFYVLPRVIRIVSPLKSIGNRYSACSSNIGTEQDFGQFESFKPYREGESVRHISWKKFITTGQPLLKEYGKTSEPGMRIYLDTRRTRDSFRNFLEMEDCSIEILVAFVKYCIDASIPVSVRGAGRHDFDFRYASGEDAQLFHVFHKHTSEIDFSPHSVSPLALFESDTELEGEWGGSVVFITCHNDMEIYDFIERNARGLFAVIVNQSGFTDTEIRQNVRYFEYLRDRGAKIFTVTGADTIAEDLAR